VDLTGDPVLLDHSRPETTAPLCVSRGSAFGTEQRSGFETAGCFQLRWGKLMIPALLDLVGFATATERSNSTAMSFYQAITRPHAIPGCPQSIQCWIAPGNVKDLHQNVYSAAFCLVIAKLVPHCQQHESQAGWKRAAQKVCCSQVFLITFTVAAQLRSLFLGDHSTTT